MKKLSSKSKILLGAFLLGSSIAVATELANQPNAQETRYDWESTSIAPENPSSSLQNATTQEAIDHYGCENGANVCANGEKVSGPGPDATTLNFGL
ncbi:hypothetical protein H8S90_01355 [Olivibacter sp. SDN3]|uniref:hypothetical protein n=1 Tax=unclassified Olivibacter TaxID=2632301 RepID=UPI001650D8C5|nr:hypothetical protein [Olivibacter sp. SDN3]QNL50306.1 hypothetical protein H8S90_01355 [Olivibacter sp. SDN3]